MRRLNITGRITQVAHKEVLNKFIMVCVFFLFLLFLLLFLLLYVLFLLMLLLSLLLLFSLLTLIRSEDDWLHSILLLMIAMFLWMTPDSFKFQPCADGVSQSKFSAKRYAKFKLEQFSTLKNTLAHSLETYYCIFTFNGLELFNHSCFKYLIVLLN